MKQFLTLLSFTMCIGGGKTFAAGAINIYCLSDLKNGTQWKVSALSNSEDPNKVTVTLSPEIGAHETLPALVFTELKEDANDGWGGFNVFDSNNNELSVYGAYGGSIKAKFRRNGSLISVNETLTCFPANDDTINFSGTANGTTVQGPFCVGSPAQPASAEASANQQAASFCGKLGRNSVRVSDFTEVHQCQLSNFEGHPVQTATDSVRVNATFRCK